MYMYNNNNTLLAQAMHLATTIQSNHGDVYIQK
jgi:hypothetical protein